MDKKIFGGIVMVLTLTACGPSSTSSQTPGGTPPPEKTISTLTGVDVVRPHNVQQIAEGAQLYQQHCASCHGATAEGNPEWRKALAEGKHLPPPLNGTGREWHSSRNELHNHIKYGSKFGKGNMPPFQNALTDAQITAVIAWFQSLWSDQLYAEWLTKHTVGSVFVDEAYKKQ
jgi:mono/diheme cytochrome c family protein